MNNNLKELIEDIKYGIQNGTDRENIKIDGYCLSWKNCKLILNEIDRLNNIIDKAIEYIEHQKFIKEQVIMKSNYEMSDYYVKILLNILRGEDK